MAEEFKSLKGHLLLDGGKLRGSFFHRTVVLICQHDAEGAMGLVLNRASGKNVGEMIVAAMADNLKKQPLFLGGPVQPQALSFLHTDEFLFNANVLPSLNLGHSLDDHRVVADFNAPDPGIGAVRKILRSRPDPDRGRDSGFLSTSTGSVHERKWPCAGPSAPRSKC